MTGFELVGSIGYLAAGATLVAFAQRDMLAMRLSALTANLFFVAYGALGSFYPVLVLHLILLPLSMKRLQDLRPLTRNPEPTRSMTLLEEWKSACSEEKAA